MKKKLRAPLFWIVLTWLSFSFWRLESERGSLLRGGRTGSVVGSRFDPRGFSVVSQVRRARAADAFRARLRHGPVAEWTWPGLAALQVSWLWLELLQGLHETSSYEGDYSWIFAKLYTIIEKSHPHEISFISGLAPFFIVIGQDPLGATFVMNELIRRDAGNWRTWFWSGFHALENLRMPRLAGDYFKHAALLPGSPFYMAPLAARLSLGENFYSLTERQKLLEQEFSPEFREKIKKARPEWFGAGPVESGI